MVRLVLGQASHGRITHRYTVLGALLLLVIAWNAFQADQSRFVFASSDAQGYINVDPKIANGIVASIDQYTPLLAESAVDFESVLEPRADEGFVAASDLENQFVTQATKLEVTYSVQGGDSITSIADKFGLHVATIAQRNGIGVDSIEDIKPGDRLIIPPADTSDSTEWLVALNQKKEAEQQKAIAAANAARATARSRKTSRSVAASGFDGSAGMNFSMPISHNGISRGVSSYHAGIDYRASTGTSVRAAQAGKVIETTGGWAGGFGISILVDHGNGLTTRYAHLSQIDVSTGQVVNQGETIGRSGNTGYSTGPHLHFETRKNGRVLSPF